MAGVQLELGGRVHDLRNRALVVGILNRTRDSFYDRGAYFPRERFLRHAERLVLEGADVIDVGARPGGVGVREVSAVEEGELVVESITDLRARFDVPLAVDTQRASVAAAAFDAGAVLGNDMSGFRDPDYLAVAARAGASVVATHIRLPPGVPDPCPVYDDVVAEVAAALAALRARAAGAGIPDERIVLDPGYDLGKTWQQTIELLAATSRLAALGRPLLAAVSNKTFLGRVLGLGIDERTEATVAACAYAVAHGARMIRVHDARAGRRVADLLGALLAAERRERAAEVP
jgi:dihydropteroate synthase